MVPGARHEFTPDELEETWPWVMGFLARNQISFSWLTPDQPDGAAFWAALYRPPIDGPVAQLADGEVIERPDVRDLANRLGLQTRPRVAEYDVAIVGGGPAGLPRRKGCARLLLSEKPPGAKPARLRAH